MEKLKKALDICAEIERLQAELRQLLLQSEIVEESAAVDEPATNEESGLHIEVSSDCHIIEEKPAVPTVNQATHGDLRKAFTINDRFRFRRELFGGDDSAFVSAIDTLSGMSDIQEAEEYLSSMSWDNDSEAVTEFMAIISNHFNRR